ncbi:MAG: GGDEF domain-containing protein [Pyrinomonadaceae bacterium]
MDSKLGLLIQLNGVFLITILLLFLRRSLKLNALKYWTTAWLCLSLALICLRLAFEYEHLSRLLFTYYFFGEYMFGFLLVAGCKNLSYDFELQTRSELLMLPFVAVAVALPMFSADFNELYTLHSLVLSGFFAAAFIAIRRSELHSFGWRVTYIALGLLTINFFLYFTVFTARMFIDFNTDLLSYNSIIDLVLQTTLGFGMVIVLLEKVLFDYKNANDELIAAHSQLEKIAHTDPLTTAFNRHAFYGFVNRHNGDEQNVSGCAGFFDIDGLKSINDLYGHSAGDSVIRFVAGSIRDIVRAEDLIFRWGGDEFFVVMISMESEMAELRMSKLERLLRDVLIDGIDRPITIGVSWGFNDFSSAEDLDAAIQKADAAMYSRKHTAKLHKEQRLAVPALQIGSLDARV